LSGKAAGTSQREKNGPVGHKKTTTRENNEKNELNQTK